jgi:hypothetical protein
MPDKEHDMEPVILPFRLPQKADSLPDNRQPETEPEDGDDVQEVQEVQNVQMEAFWAGRNHAMRRSARVAA